METFTYQGKGNFYFIVISSIIAALVLGYGLFLMGIHADKGTGFFLSVILAELLLANVFLRFILKKVFRYFFESFTPLEDGLIYRFRGGDRTVSWAQVSRLNFMDSVLQNREFMLDFGSQTEKPVIFSADLVDFDRLVAIIEKKTEKKFMQAV